MNRGWADFEVALDVSLCWRLAKYLRVSVDEGQILALLFGEIPLVGHDRFSMI